MAALDSVTEFIKVPNIDGAMIFGVLTYVILFILFLIVVGISVWVIILKLKYNKKIVIFEKINGQFEASKKDRGMIMRHGEAGDTILFIKKLKKFQPTPTLQTGRNTFWFFMREDGELINFTPGDFDAQSRELGAHFLDKEMRYARVSLQNSLKERHEKVGFWSQYGVLVVNISVIVIIMVFLWLIVDKLIDLASTANGAIEASKEVTEATKDVIVALNNLQTGGSGYIPAS